MRTINVTSLVRAVCLSLLALLPTHVLAASTDAARVAGDLKVDGIHFSVDDSVQTKACPWGNGDPNNAYNIGIVRGNVGIGTLTPSAELEVIGMVKTNQLSATGNIILVDSTATTGNIMKGAVPFIHNYGVTNTFIGRYAGNFTMTGLQNSASGYSALSANTTGSDNTATGNTAMNMNTTGSQNTAAGSFAMYSNTTGSQNTALGSYALEINTTGSNNTASGSYALYINSTGNDNTANGHFALQKNTTGSFNTASGSYTLNSNTTGDYNTATGFGSLSANTTGFSNTANGESSLMSNTTGNYNTASGDSSLMQNTTGEGNTASGHQALFSNTTGLHNTAIGYEALLSNSTGSHNIGIGIQAGQNVTTGDNNIHIANPGASESNTTRIGSIQTATYIAGIFGATSTAGTAVYINSSGQLGTATSSRRFKEEITDMGDATDALMKLRPVTFYYKPEYASGPRLLQYGLIAEEVAQVYPDLVQYNDKGEINTVYYQFVNAMLLNEVQKQHGRIDDQQRSIETLKVTNEILKADNEVMKARLERLEKTLYGR